MSVDPLTSTCILLLCAHRDLWEGTDAAAATSFAPHCLVWHEMSCGASGQV